MRLNQAWVLGLKSKDLDDIMFRKVRIQTTQAYTCGDNTGQSFDGFFSTASLAANPPHLPAYLRFVDSSILDGIPERVSSEVGTDILITDFEWVEFED